LAAAGAATSAIGDNQPRHDPARRRRLSVTFNPNLIDEHGNIGDESTKKFLQDFVDRFAHLVARLAPATQA
jgi:hypothetical protein